MQRVSIATFTAVLFLAAVNCGPLGPQDQPSQVSDLSETANAPNAGIDSEDARQKRQLLLSPAWAPWPYSYHWSPVYYLRKRRDTSDVSANEQPADVSPAQQQRDKRGAFVYTTYSYPLYHGYYVYPKSYSTHYWYKK